ncbi:MAG: sporulation protein YqfD [Clostridia bacterium]|nr:sporulation protein YqfD [Clostridia bacterium]
MIFIKIFRFLCGYIYFCGDGGFPERFINLCAASGISLWDIESHGGKIFGKTNIKGYKKIRNPSKKSSTKIRIKSKVGLPFIIRRNRNRKFLLMGAVVFIIGISLLSNTVWTVKVVGNKAVPDEEIISVLSDMGLNIGSRVSSLDRKDISKKTRDKIPLLAWVSVNVEGCTATVEVKEKLEIVSDEDTLTTPSDVVALSDGELVYIETYQGTRIQEIGSGVVKGDVIISGIVEYKTTTTNFYHAEGYVEAKTKRQIKIDTKNSDGYKYKKIRKSYKLLVLGLEIPITPYLKETKNSHSFTSSSFLKVGDTVLPFGIERTVVSYYEKSKVSEPLAAITKLICKQTNDLSHLKILSRNIGSNDGNLTAEYTCLENIAAQGELKMEISEENEN